MCSTHCRLSVVTDMLLGEHCAVSPGASPVCADGSDLKRVTFATFFGTDLVFSDGEGSLTVFPGTVCAM